MSEFIINIVTKEQRENAAGLMLPEAAEILLSGAPMLAIAAVCEKKAVGVLAGAVTDGAFRVQSLFVHPDYRRRGAGKALFAKLMEVLEDIPVSVSADYTLQCEDNQVLEPFLLSTGFHKENFRLPSYGIFQVFGLHLKGLPAISKDKRLMFFESITDRLLRATSNICEANGYPMPEGGLHAPKVVRDLSVAIVSEDTVHGYVTVEAAQKDMLFISALWSELREPRLLMGMLGVVFARLQDTYPMRTRVAIAIRDEKALNFLKMIGGNLSLCSRRFTLDRR